MIKSERLKKLEADLNDLEQWLKLGLVPKSDIEKHRTEIEQLRNKIEDESERLRVLKESGDIEEYTAPKRNPQGRPTYQEPQTLPGVDVENDTYSDSGSSFESESFRTAETTASGTEEGSGEMTSTDEEDDPFSDKNRWRRGILEDPESDQW